MTSSSTLIISDTEYNAIEDALQSTQKGRRFLRAYADRNRSLELRKLLRTISRLHGAMLGAPGTNAQISRDLESVAKSVARGRKVASACRNADDRAKLLAANLQDVEATLLSLIESLEERNLEAARDEMEPSYAEDGHKHRLYAELSSYFSGGRL
jgi:hypothetical protein